MAFWLGVHVRVSCFRSWFIRDVHAAIMRTAVIANGVNMRIGR
jgi:hypothetical protein